METKEFKYTMPELTLKYNKGNIPGVKVTSSRDSQHALRQMFDADTISYQESFIAIFLNRANNTIGWFKVSQGGIAGTVVDIRILYATALKCGACGIIIAHNHPSGQLKPSSEDLSLTKKIKEAGNVLDIKLLDHLILTDESYYSFADEGLI